MTIEPLVRLGYASKAVVYGIVGLLAAAPDFIAEGPLGDERIQTGRPNEPTGVVANCGSDLIMLVPVVIDYGEGNCHGLLHAKLVH